MKKPNSFFFRTGLTVSLLLMLLFPSMSWGDWSVLFFDDFDDGNFDGWNVTHHVSGEPTTPPDINSSPEGYSLRGIGSGYSNDPGLYVYLTYPITLNNIGELKIEMRAKSGPQWPNQANVILVSKSDFYLGRDYGESNQRADFDSEVNGVENRYSHSINANVWHDFAWTRDAEDWWSLSIDGQEVWHNFCQDNQLTSFDKIGIHILRNQSEIEWIRISGVPKPAKGWIAFASNRDGDNDIWAIRADGGDLKQLINQPSSQNGPEWSPDSTKIVYSSDGEAQLWVYDWFTGENNKIYDAHNYQGQDLGSFSVARPCWSPDGSKILFTEYYDPHLTVINADGTGRQVLPISGFMGSASWGPSGTAIVYEMRNNPGVSYSNDLWIYDFTGTCNIMNGINHRLTGGGSSPGTTKVDADWTPSGDIVFAWGENIAIIDPGKSPNWNGPISDPLDPRVTFLTSEGQPGSRRCVHPSWSPDLSQIVYRYDPELWIIDASGNNPHQLCSEGAIPDWGNPPPEPACMIYDDFESYGVGSYPSPKWSVMYSGNYAQVSAEQAYSGNQSFKLVGHSGWSRADAVSVSFPENFTYSFAVMIAPDSAGGCVGIAKTWGGASPVNGVNFNPDGDYFTWEGPEIYPHLLEECMRGKWYKVSVTIKDFSSESPTADVTIAYDGTSVTHTDIPAYPRDLANRNLLQLHTFSRAATQIYFDDVCIAKFPKPKGLVAYWSFDDSTNPGHDDSGSGHNGTVYGAEPSNGICESALRFDGLDDYVEIPYDPSFNLSSFTLQAWVKFSQSDSIASMICRPNDGNPTDGYSFFRLDNSWGRIGGGVQGEGQSYSSSISTGPTTFADDAWHMCHFVRDVLTNEISIYVDGISNWSYPDSSPGDMEHNFKGIIIGSTDGSTDFFEGSIDEVRIYDRALSECEIRELATPCGPLFVVYGLHSLHLQQAIITGNVGANNAQSGEWINPYLPYEIEIGAATINGSAYGDTVKLGPGAHVTGSAYCNEAIIWYDYGAILDGDEVSPLVLPVPDPSPAFPVFAAGIDDITVNSGDTMTLQPGDYGKVELQKGYWNSSTVLQLEGGVYNLGELVLGYNTRVECLNPCEIRIKGRLSATAVAAIIPAVESDLSAGDIQIFVEGINGTTGGASETPKAVVLGTVTDTEAHIYAPNGTIEIGGNKTNARGVFIGKWVKIFGSATTVTLE